MPSHDVRTYPSTQTSPTAVLPTIEGEFKLLLGKKCLYGVEIQQGSDAKLPLLCFQLGNDGNLYAGYFSLNGIDVHAYKVEVDVARTQLSQGHPSLLQRLKGERDLTLFSSSNKTLRVPSSFIQLACQSKAVRSELVLRARANQNKES